MGEFQGSNDDIVNELKNIKKRLDGLHSWLAAFIVITILFYFVIIGIIVLPF